MQENPFKNQSNQPTNDLVFSVIGKHKPVWVQTFNYLHNNYPDITESWNYYKDGKSWLLKVMKKKTTIFWVNILDDTFRTAFYFANRLEPQILESDITQDLKDQLIHGKLIGKIKCIYIDVQRAVDIENIQKLIELKLKLK